MDKESIRRANLRTIIDLQFDGTDGYLADAAEVPRPNISELLRGKRPFTERRARDLEKRLGLKFESLDIPPIYAQDISANDQVLLDKIRALLIERHAPPHVHSAILTLLESCPIRSR